MTQFSARRHRLALPPVPPTDDPATIKRAMDDMRRLVQDEFNRLATDFYDFKKTTYEAAIIPLRGVANIATVVDEFSVQATWENPQQVEITPTHVRIRILEISPNDFAEYTYPINSWEFDGLLPGTQYTLQIQLVARFETTDTFVSTTRNCPSVPVLRVAESDIKARVFTTPAGVGPPTDNDTDDEQVVFTFPDTDGTPGPAAGTDCYWGYKFQYRTACAWADTAVSEVEVDGDIGDVTVDTGAVPFTTFPNTLFRMAYREICDAVAGDWVYGESFMAVDFSNSDCLGIVKSASYLTTPFSSADVIALPGACQEDGTWLQIVEERTEIEFTRGTGLKCMEYIDNEWTLIGKDTSLGGAGPVWQPMISGNLPAVGALTNTNDFTLGFDVKFPIAYNTTGAPLTSYPIITIGDKINVYYLSAGTTFELLLTVPRDGGGTYNFRTGQLATGTWHTIYYSHDVSEPDGRELFVEDLPVAVSADAVDNDFDDITNAVRVNTMPQMELRKFYMWDFLVSAPPAVPLPALLTAWYDGSRRTATGITEQVDGGEAEYLNALAATIVGPDGKTYPRFHTTATFDTASDPTPPSGTSRGLTGDMSVVAVGRLPSTFPGGQRAFMQKKGTSTWRDVGLNIGETALSITWYNTSNSSKTSRSSFHSFDAGDWFFFAFDSDGYAYLHDGTQLTTNNSVIFTSGSFQTTGAMNLGMIGPTNEIASMEWNDGWGHLMFFDGDLSVAQVQAVGKYFTDRGWTF